MQRKYAHSFLMAMLIGCSFNPSLFADTSIPTEIQPKNWQSDAELTDVFFLNEKLGWAVGAQGVILRTTNGGQDWLELSQAAPTTTGPQLSFDEKIRAMQSGTKTPWTGVADGRSNQLKPYCCRFESIHFVDEKHGWVAGGYDIPYVNRSRAVVLKTNDGGMSWRPVEGIFVSRIRKIHFSDRANGWALGDQGNLFRTGISYTADGGETWSSQSSIDLQNWIDGEATPTGFVNIAKSGQSAVVNNNRMEVSVMMGGAQASLNRIRLLDAKQGWAVGNSGSVVQTNDGGRSWSPITSRTQSPEAAALLERFRQFDFRALAISPGKIWFAGNPGSVVFSIDRQSGSISTYTTGVAIPVNDLHFIDDQRGWAVGLLGTILSTTDGGNSWQVQRGQHRSVAMLGVATAESELPFEALANFGVEENRVCAAAVFQSTIGNAVQQASERLGSTGVLAIGSGLENQLSSADRDLEIMVRTIRSMRPNVIVSNSNIRATTSRTGSAAHYDPESFLKKAIRAAVDRNAYPQQLELAHLETWSVDRLAVRDPVGSVTIDPHRMLPRAGMLIEDQIALSRALLQMPIAVTAKPSYRVEYFSVANYANESDLFAGLSQLGRKVPTRISENGFRGSLNAIQLANSKQKKLEEFSRFDLNTSQDLRVWNQQIMSWAMSLDESVAGIWLAQLAENYLEQGKTELAANTLEVLAIRLYKHAFAPAAMTWLVQFNASDEFGQIGFRRWLQTRDQQQSYGDQQWTGHGQRGESATQITQSQSGGVSKLVWTPVADTIRRPKTSQDDRGEIALVGLEADIPADLMNEEQLEAESPTATRAEIDSFFQSRWQRASQLLGQLGQRDPDLVGGPEYRWLESQINRKLSGALAADTIWKQLGQSQSSNSQTRLGAHRELSLSGSGAHSSNIANVHCQRVLQRPRLDGTLDDNIWQTLMQNETVTRLSRPVETAGQGSDAEADVAMFAYDDQFLYVAIRCGKIPGQFYRSNNDSRPRDADLSRRDRVAFSLDVDRDYRSSNDFVVDYRGWCHESCSGARGWNPDWFIGHHEDQATWTIELAIPLEQLTATTIQPDDVWAIRLARRTTNETNLWDRGSGGTSAASIGETGPDATGLRIGLTSRATEFELLQFD